MVNAQQLRAFLGEWYLHSRFEGRDGVNGWPNDYSETIVQHAIEDLENHGKSLIGMYESRTGKRIEFDSDLKILNADEAPPQIQAQHGSLARIYHGNAW